ncbi:MAG TPA: nucleotide disphospho-sugar-binding domain-containing protein [Frankiaceae bacterium]|nr:nucleotide disphospho-sugar-binding domain-containing protein [Frankiaceae bacterium]
MKIAVVAGPAPGHAFPAASLATALQGRGHEVLVVTGVSWLPALERAGLPAEHLPLLKADPRDAIFGFRLYGRAAEQARPLADQLTAAGVEAIVSDTLTVAGAFAADLMGVPWVELIPHPLQDYSVGLPAPGAGLQRGRNPITKGRDAMLRAMHRKGLRQGASERAEARSGLGLTDGERMPNGRLVATLPGMEIARPDWPANTVIVGPMEWDPAEWTVGNKDVPLPPGDAPLVFVSASTAPTGATGLLEASLVACEMLGLRLVSTQFDTHDGPLPEWASVGPGRQAPALAAAAVVVAGGGHGMLAKALIRGLPQLVIPGGGEQFDNARRLKRAGAAIPILPMRLSTAKATTAVARLVGDPRYRLAAERLGATARHLGPDYAARMVERFLDPAQRIRERPVRSRIAA